MSSLRSCISHDSNNERKRYQLCDILLTESEKLQASLERNYRKKGLWGTTKAARLLR